MRIALMVEGQESVSWEEWLALAETCEAHGLEAMFRSDHYSSPTDTNRLPTHAWTLPGAFPLSFSPGGGARGDAPRPPGGGGPPVGGAPAGLRGAAPAAHRRRGRPT